MATITKDELIDAISSMTVLELSELVKALEDKFGVSAAAPVAMMGMMPGAGAAAAAAPEEEKTTFDVELTDIGPEKIKVIKVAREVKPGLGLKEAKTLVEEAPTVVLEGVNKEEAEKAKKAFEEVGAKITIK